MKKNKKMNEDLKSLINEFLPYAQKQLGLKGNIKIILKQDEQNAKDPLGKTAFYDPDNISITLFISGRHVKDCLRSLAHELVHHYQNYNGQFRDNRFKSFENYFLKSKYMRNLEKEAYEKGNMLLRSFEEESKKSNQSGD